MMVKGVTAATFFKGDRARGAATLRTRLGEVLAVNPWLAGTFVKAKTGRAKAELSVPAEPDVDTVFFDSADHEILPDATYVEMERTSREKLKAEVVEGSYLINKGVPVTKLTVFRAGPGGWGFILSISHSAVDGNSFYRVLDMLSPANPLVALTLPRVMAFPELANEALGKAEQHYTTSAPLIMNMVGSMVKTVACGGVKCRAYYVDPTRVEAAKGKAKAGGAVEFVSTNDLLTSAFINASKPLVTMTAINLRDKIEGIGADLAGNYEAALLLDRESGATPALVRQSLAARRRVSGASLPGFCQTVGMKTALFTSWVFPLALELEGHERGLHLPLMNVAEIPFDIAIPFRPLPGRLAAMYWSKRLDQDALVGAADSVLGEAVDSAVFG